MENVNHNLAVAYFRVSTKKQEEEGYSLENQEERALKYAKDNNLKIVKQWGGNESGWINSNEKVKKKIRRKLFNEMLEYVRNHKEIKHLIFYSQDRMTRNMDDYRTIETLRETTGLTVHFSQTGDKQVGKLTSDKKMFGRMRENFDEYFSDFISEKTAPAMIMKAKTGVYPAKAPLGYLNNKVDKTIELDTERAPLIKELFEYAASGKYSLLMLEEEFYIKGLRSKDGKRVHKSALHRILRSSFYYGYFVWSGQMFKGTHTPIISKELWDRANKRLKDFYRPHKTKHNFAFAEVLKCEHCNCNIIGEKRKGKFIYYHCSQSKQRHYLKGYLREELLADKLGNFIKSVSIPKDMGVILQKGIDIISDEKEKIEATKKKTLMCEKIQAEKDLKKLYEREFAEEDMNDMKKEFYRQKEKELSQTIETSNQELENFGADKKDILLKNNMMIEMLSGLDDLYNRCDIFEKGKIAKYMLDTSTLSSNNEIKVKYRRPFDIFNDMNEDLNTPIVIEKTDTVIDFKDYVKYIFDKFDVVSEFKSNFYKILGINKNNIGLTTDVIPKDLLFKNSINFFIGSNHTQTGIRVGNLYDQLSKSSLSLPHIKKVKKYQELKKKKEKQS